MKATEWHLNLASCLEVGIGPIGPMPKPPAIGLPFQKKSYKIDVSVSVSTKPSYHFLGNLYYFNLLLMKCGLACCQIIPAKISELRQPLNPEPKISAVHLHWSSSAPSDILADSDRCAFNSLLLHYIQNEDINKVSNLWE